MADVWSEYRRLIDRIGRVIKVSADDDAEKAILLKRDPRDKLIIIGS